MKIKRIKVSELVSGNLFADGSTLYSFVQFDKEEQGEYPYYLDRGYIVVRVLAISLPGEFTDEFMLDGSYKEYYEDRENEHQILRKPDDMVVLFVP